jgi:IS30 family transposase
MTNQDKAVGGALYKYLRHQHKKYRKRYGKNDYRGRIPNRIDIDERPSIVDARTRIGDWEVDLVIGKGHKGGFATLAERKSDGVGICKALRLPLCLARQSGRRFQC